MLFLDALISVKYLFWKVLKESCYRAGIVNNPLLFADAFMGEGAYQTTQALMWLLCVFPLPPTKHFSFFLVIPLRHFSDTLE